MASVERPGTSSRLTIYTYSERELAYCASVSTALLESIQSTGSHTLAPGLLTSHSLSSTIIDRRIFLVHGFAEVSGGGSNRSPNPPRLGQSGITRWSHLDCVGEKLPWFDGNVDASMLHIGSDTC